MRIACEVMLDKVADSPIAEGGVMARAINEELLRPGQHIFITGDNGTESEYVVTSTNAWEEDMRPGMTEEQMTAETGATSTDESRAYRTVR